MPVIVTNCTARKRGRDTVLVMTPDLIGTTLPDTVANWLVALSMSSALRPAQDLYGGRSIAEARLAAKHADASLFFVSAGIGIVHAEALVPAYDLTPAQASGGLATALNTHRASPADWWHYLSRAGLSRLVREHADQQVLIALPSTYMKMLARDLAEMRPEDATRMRIFTSPAGADEVPASLRVAVLPYDERLESVTAYSGTRADFPQRAMRHYIESLDASRASIEEGRQLVENSLSAYGLRQIPHRQRLDDRHIKALIVRRWDSCDGRSSALLRALRDEELVACEQSRFAKIWHEVRNEVAYKRSIGVQ